MREREREREREKYLWYVVDIKNKHVLIIEIFPSQILSLLVLKEIKREYIYIYIYIYIYLKYVGEWEKI